MLHAINKILLELATYTNYTPQYSMVKIDLPRYPSTSSAISSVATGAATPCDSKPFLQHMCVLIIC